MWKQQWMEPPQTTEELYIWKIYCRIFNDVGLPTPGCWIHLWMRNNVLDKTNDDNNYVVREAIRWYTLECRE